jgi:hypothetical protein
MKDGLIAAYSQTKCVRIVDAGSQIEVASDEARFVDPPPLRFIGGGLLGAYPDRNRGPTRDGTIHAYIFVYDNVIHQTRTIPAETEPRP